MGADVAPQSLVNCAIAKFFSDGQVILSITIAFMNIYHFFS
jgi:hypothetical protein